MAFFFKWAVDNDWIGPAGRVILGLLAGFATFAAADFIWRKRQQVFAQGITATGIAIIYLALYAAFDFYHLFRNRPLFPMVATTAMAAVLALRYSRSPLRRSVWLLRYLTPLFLSTGEDHPWFLFSYLLLLNFAATELARLGSGPARNHQLLATTLIYGGWLLDRGTHPKSALWPRWRRWLSRRNAGGRKHRLLFSFSQFLTAFASPIHLASRRGTSFLSPCWWPWLVWRSPSYALSGYTSLRRLSAFGFTTRAIWTLHEPSPFLGISCGFLLFLAWSCWHLLQQRAAPPPWLSRSSRSTDVILLRSLLQHPSQPTIIFGSARWPRWWPLFT